MRPRVRSEELVVLCEAFAQVGGEAVVDRTPVGVVGIHVAEGDASREGPSGAGSAGGVESLAGEVALELLCEGHATGPSRDCGAQIQTSDGRIQAAGTKEIHQR